MTMLMAFCIFLYYCICSLLLLSQSYLFDIWQVSDAAKQSASNSVSRPLLITLTLFVLGGLCLNIVLGLGK